MQEPFRSHSHCYKETTHKEMKQLKKIGVFKCANDSKQMVTGEQELLSIIETLKEFRNILFGHKLIIHTDHKNLLYKKLSSDRIV